MKRHLLLLVIMIGTVLSATAQQVIDLSGTWKLALGDKLRYNDNVTLPGSLLTNGKGDEVTSHTVWTGSTYDSSYYFNPYMEKYRVEGNIKYPFFLTPEKHYVGNAWYKKTVMVPATWQGEHIYLYLERPHIETTVYVNGQKAGHQLSLSTPHQYDITPYVKAGKNNEIVVCVYNGIENVCVGQDSHSVTDQTQGNWNGITGCMELRTAPTPRIRISHDLATHTATIQMDDDTYQVSLGKTIHYWNEFDPYLYTRIINHHGIPYTVTFGIRDISIERRQIYLNHQPIWFRGTVENCCFPETGYPPTDVESWLRIMRKVKEYGLNHIRFHSYCPPDAAFTAADIVGIYLQPEGPSWPNHGVKLRAGQKIDQYLLEESKRIIDTYGHHPSFVMMAAGNEPAGDWVSYCNDWVKEMKKYDSSKIYCGASVGGGWAWDNGSEYHVKGGARGLDWNNRAPHSDDDYLDQIAFPRNYRDSVANSSPIIAHEQGQWCAFPDFNEISQYTGVYKARNFEIFQDLLRDNGMGHLAERFLMASGHLQTLAYKYEIERNLRTPDYAGFQLLALNDYSGQGTALEGVLNVHWKEKGYTTAKEWTQFCAPVVPLARFPQFVYSSTDTLNVPIEVYNASGKKLMPIKTSFSILNEQKEILYKGTLTDAPIPIGKNIAVGTVCMPLQSITQPSKLTLSISIGDTSSNQWEFWVFPQLQATEDTSNLYICDELSDAAIDVLRKGGKVLLTAAGKVRYGNDIIQHYLPVFWNTSWFKMRPPHTTGAFIDKDHPLFKYGFPTDNWSNLNWWELLNKAQVMNLTSFPKEYQSPIQPIDTWHVSRKIGMLIEANVLNGKLLMTTMDIDSNQSERLVARQMKSAILRYMNSDDFTPKLSLDIQVIQDLFDKEAPKVNMFTKESPDELKPVIKPSS